MTSLEVSVAEYRRVLTPREIGLTRDARTVSTLRNDYVPLWFSARTDWRWRADFDAPPGFQRYVDMYSEASTRQPVYTYFRTWKSDETLKRIHDAILAKVRRYGRA